MNYDQSLVIEVARMYHEAKLSQFEISQRVKCSRSTVSRMLKCAEESGFVKVVVIDPSNNIKDLEGRMKALFGLKDAHIISNHGDDVRRVRANLGKAGAEYLVSILKPRDMLGVAWGYTTLEIAKHMPEFHAEISTVVSIGGCTYEQIMDESMFDMLHLFARKLSAPLRMLYTPIIVSSIEAKRAYLSDRNTSLVMEYIEKCNIVINGINYLGKHSLIYQYGYVSESEIETLRAKGAVGNFCSRYFDREGNEVDQDLGERTIGISAESMRKKEYSIGVAAGREKCAAILGMLKGRLINVLITDIETAKGILDLYEGSLK